MQTQLLLLLQSGYMNWEAADSEWSQVWQRRPSSKEKAGPSKGIYLMSKLYLLIQQESRYINNNTGLSAVRVLAAVKITAERPCI